MMSRRPCRETASPTRASRSCQRVTSVRSKKAVPPARWMRSSVDSPPSSGSAVRSASATAAPSAAKARAMARPIPELAPVTTATFPASIWDIRCDNRQWIERQHASRTMPILNAVTPDLKLAASLFDALADATRRGRGIVRDSYGAGEQAAHDIVGSAARRIGLEVAPDALGNLIMTLPGRDRQVPRILIGSHLDSVPQGGNYDGAAGVVAGLCALETLRRARIIPDCDIAVVAIRA